MLLNISLYATGLCSYIFCYKLIVASQMKCELENQEQPQSF